MKNTKCRLTARQVQTFGPGKYADGGGLYLKVEAMWSRHWVFRYTSEGRRREYGLGGFPRVSLAQARELATAASALLGAGIDPLTHRADEEKKAAARLAGQQSFGDFCDEWIKTTIEPGLKSGKQIAGLQLTLGDAYCSKIRSKPISEIDTDDVLLVLKDIWKTRHETATRLRGRIERALDVATVSGARDEKPSPTALGVYFA